MDRTTLATKWYRFYTYSCYSVFSTELECSSTSTYQPIDNKFEREANQLLKLIPNIQIML